VRTVNILHIKRVLLLLIAVATCLVFFSACDSYTDNEPDEVSASPTAATSEAIIQATTKPEANIQEATVPSGELQAGGIMISQGDAVEGVFTGDERFGSGYVDMSGEGVQVDAVGPRISAHARPLRRIVKQDVNGRELNDSFYLYRNLLNDAEKRVYDQVYANAVELDPDFNISTNVHYEQLHGIVLGVRFDNPDLFWLDNTYRYTYDQHGYITSVTLTFFDDAVRNIDAYKGNFYKATDSVLEHVMAFDDDIYKMKFIHDFLTNINTYEWADMNQSAYSAVWYGRTVCAGYSMAFHYYMQRLGIPSAVLRGYAGEDHIWNIVNVGGEWYEMDVTWNNPIGSAPNVYFYNYFNITTGAISDTHRRYEPSALLPDAGGTYYSYANYFGNQPGSDFSAISYGNPSHNLPPVYPAAGSQHNPGPQAGHAPSPDDDHPGDAPPDGLYADAGSHINTTDAVEEWLINMSDDEWHDLWDYLEEVLSDEEYWEVNDMDWDDLIGFLTRMMNENG